MGGYGYGQSSVPSKNYAPPKADYNYEALTKNHMPSSQKDTGSYDYGKKISNNDYTDAKSYNNAKSRNDPYDYSNKPPSYPQQNNTRNRNVQSMQQPEYDEYPSYSAKNVGKSSTAQTKAS